MNQKVKNITKSMIFVGLIASTPSNAQGTDKNESFISQVKITEDTIASKTHKSLSDVLVEKVASFGDSTKTFGKNIKSEIFNLINHAAAIAPNMFILGKLAQNGEYKDCRWEPKNPEAILIAALSPIVTHIGLQKAVLPLIEDCIDLCTKNKELGERLKQRFRDTTNFCGTRIVLSILLYKYLLKYTNELSGVTQ